MIELLHSCPFSQVYRFFYLEGGICKVLWWITHLSGQMSHFSHGAEKVSTECNIQIQQKMGQMSSIDGEYGVNATCVGLKIW